jgi:hypothetical protein
MTEHDLELMERWQASSAGKVGRRISDLSCAADDLTTLAQSREGAHILRKNYPELVSVLRKIHDLVLDFKPGVST